MLPLLLVLFIAVPIIELAVILQVGELIGLWWTIALLIVDSILGAMLMRSQGRAAWRRFNEALAAPAARRRARSSTASSSSSAARCCSRPASSPTSSACCSCSRPRARSCAACSCGASPARMVAVAPPARAPARPRPRLRRRGHRDRGRPPPPAVTPVGPEHEAPQARGAARATRSPSRSATRPRGLYGLARAGVVRRPSASGMGIALRRAPTSSRRCAAEGVDGRGASSRCAAGARRSRASSTLEVEALRARRAGGRRGRRHAGLRAALPRPRHGPPAARARRLPRPARALVGRAGLVEARARADGHRVARRPRPAVTLSAVRPASAKHHADEASRRTSSSAASPVPVADPRLSTTYDGDGRQRHAGLELWVGDGEGEYPHRAAGEVALRDDARPRAAAAGLRVLRVADGGPHRRRALRRAARARDPRRSSATSAACSRRRCSAASRTCRRRTGSRSRRSATRWCARPSEHGENPLFALERGEMTEARVPRPARRRARAGGRPRASRCRTSPSTTSRSSARTTS